MTHRLAPYKINFGSLYDTVDALVRQRRSDRSGCDAARICPPADATGSLSRRTSRSTSV
jgi:hypothetical protein